MPIDVVSLGQRIQQVREMKRMSLGELATSSGLAKSYVGKLERGEVGNPGVRTLGAIAIALGLTVGALLRTQNAQNLSADDEAEADLQLAEKLRGKTASLPIGLRELANKREADGRPLTPQVLNSLALVQFRGKRPQTAEDWEFLLYALERSTMRK